MLLDESFGVSGVKCEEGVVLSMSKEEEEKSAEDTMECADRKAFVVFTVAVLLDEKDVSVSWTFLL
jgi:hypothetical protein